MRCNSLTVLFFALFALFSTLAYAAPVAPRGDMMKRQCQWTACRETSDASSSPSSSSPNAIINAIYALLGVLANPASGTQPGAVPSAYVSSSAVAAPTAS